MTPVQVVEKQLAAFNTRNLKEFLASYAEDARVHDLQGGRPTLVGRRAIAAVYARVFENEGLRGEVLARLTVGNKVIHHKRCWGLGPDAVDFVAVYEVAGDHIRTAWLHRANQLSEPTMVEPIAAISASGA
jgi:hypothetical protein